MASKGKAKIQKSDPMVKELDAIKRLLILQLVTSGVQAGDIASALQVDRSVISRLFPTRKVKRPSTR
jgi:hypothetical protein